MAKGSTSADGDRAAAGTFGEMLRRLRMLRGLTQEALARAAGVGMLTIYRAERSDTCALKLTTLAKITKALGTMSEPDAAAWESATGVRSVLETARAAVGLSEHAQTASTLIDLYRQLPTDQATAHQWLQELIDRTSPNAVLTALQSLAQMSGVDLSPPFRTGMLRPTAKEQAGQTMRVVAPPQQRPGYVEQVVTEYEVRPDQRSQSAKIPEPRRSKSKGA